MLARAGFGHYPLFAHAFGQQHLAQGVVDLVRSEVVQVFPLEVNMRAAELSAQVGAMEHRRGATAEMGVKMVQFGIESRVIPVAKIGFGQFVQHVFQRIGHKLSAVGTEKAFGFGGTGNGSGGGNGGRKSVDGRSVHDGLLLGRTIRRYKKPQPMIRPRLMVCGKNDNPALEEGPPPLGGKDVVRISIHENSLP